MDCDEATYFENDNNSKNKTGIGRIVASAGAGVFLGGASTMLMGMAKAEDAPDDSSQEEHDHLSHPEWIVDDMDVATAVNDDMSFGEAFAAARAEVGAGGVFEWHGGLYGTYTANEWNSMSAAQKAEFENHFSWNHTSPISQASDSHAEVDVVSVSLSDEEIEASLDEAIAQEINPMDDSVQDVEILGVCGDDLTDSDLQPIDGDEVIMVDIDENMLFDHITMDLNEDGITDNYTTDDFIYEG